MGPLPAHTTLFPVLGGQVRLGHPGGGPGTALPQGVGQAGSPPNCIRGSNPGQASPPLELWSGAWAALDLCKVLDAVSVASLLRHGPLFRILALPGTVLLINKLETISIFFPHYPQTIII